MCMLNEWKQQKWMDDCKRDCVPDSLQCMISRKFLTLNCNAAGPWQPLRDNPHSLHYSASGYRTKEEFHALMVAERAARLQHHLTRKPRTRGVLFKRLLDRSLVMITCKSGIAARRRTSRKGLGVENIQQEIMLWINNRWYVIIVVEP